MEGRRIISVRLAPEFRRLSLSVHARGRCSSGRRSDGASASSEPDIAACPEPLEDPDQPLAPHPFSDDPAARSSRPVKRDPPLACPTRSTLDHSIRTRHPVYSWPSTKGDTRGTHEQRSPLADRRGHEKRAISIDFIGTSGPSAILEGRSFRSWNLARREEKFEVGFCSLSLCLSLR